MNSREPGRREPGHTVDLSLVPIEDLADELISRLDDAVILGCQDNHGVKPDNVIHNWKGRTFNVLGMMELMKYRILDWYDGA